MSEHRCCRACKYWIFQYTDETCVEEWGECRRHAPRPVLDGRRAKVNSKVEAAWPITRPFNFCGDYSVDYKRLEGPPF